MNQKTYTGVKIKKLVNGGYGLAWAEGKTLFVKNVIPGEIIKAKESGKKGGSIVVEPIRILESSPDRRVPICQYNSLCGGCDWLYIDYPAQLNIKKEILIECFVRIGKIKELPEIQMYSADEWNYRIRVQFKTDIPNKKIGFYQHNSHTIIDIQQCPLLDESLNALLHQKEILLTGLTKHTRQLKAIAGHSYITSFPIIKKATKKFTEINVDSHVYRLTGKSFFQANKYLHHDLGVWARSHISTQYCIDMYGGVGFFSCLLGDLFKQGMLVEMDKNQADLARYNLVKNRINHFHVLHTDARSINKMNIPFSSDLSSIIVDPPRVGLAKQVIQHLLKICPAQIIYVSCNPATQARDINTILQSKKYDLSSIAMFDLYPNTHHIESTVLLNKK